MRKNEKVAFATPDKGSSQIFTLKLKTKEGKLNDTSGANPPNLCLSCPNGSTVTAWWSRVGPTPVLGLCFISKTKKITSVENEATRKGRFPEEQTLAVQPQDEPSPFQASASISAVGGNKWRCLSGFPSRAEDARCLVNPVGGRSDINPHSLTAPISAGRLFSQGQNTVKLNVSARSWRSGSLFHEIYVQRPFQECGASLRMVFLVCTVTAGWIP